MSRVIRVQPAEAQPGRAADPRQEGRDGAGGPRVLAQANRHRRPASALESAIANAENNHDLEVDDLVVAEAHVGKSIVIKRFHARGRGRAASVVEAGSRTSRSLFVKSRAGCVGEDRWVRRSIRIGLRLGINRTWDSRWFAGKNEYGKLLHEDIDDPRRACTSSSSRPRSSRIVIERPHKKCRVTIHSARPGVVIGKKGADIEKLRK